MLADLLASLAALPYLGEPIDQLAHALQAGSLASEAGDDDELVAAALLHDIARAPSIKGRGPHERVGETWCAPRFGVRVAWLVGAHVEAKRYLVATEPSYALALSAASVASLRRQGGARVDATFTAHPWCADACVLRRWDDAAKIPGAPTMSVAEALVVLERVAGRDVVQGSSSDGDTRRRFTARLPAAFVKRRRDRRQR